MKSLIRQSKSHYRSGRIHFGTANRKRNILFAIYLIRTDIRVIGCWQNVLPNHFAGFGIKCPDLFIFCTTDKHQASGGHQRTNRFRLEDYRTQQHALIFHSPKIQIRTYLTQENTGGFVQH